MAAGDTFFEKCLQTFLFTTVADDLFGRGGWAHHHAVAVAHQHVTGYDSDPAAVNGTAQISAKMNIQAAGPVLPAQNTGGLPAVTSKASRTGPSLTAAVTPRSCSQATRI